MKNIEKKARKVLNKKIIQLNDIIADIDSLLTDLSFHQLSQNDFQ